MYAVIKSGGKQHKAEPGSEILVEYLGLEGGKKLSYDPLMVVDDKGKVDLAGNTKVAATVVGTERAAKVLAFRYSPRKRYSVIKGHKRQLSRIRIDSIGKGAGEAKKVAPKKAASKKAATPSSADKKKA